MIEILLRKIETLEKRIEVLERGGSHKMIAFNLENEFLKKFILEKTIESRGERVKAMTLYNAYCAYCEENGVEPINLTLFGKNMNNLPFKKKSSNGIHYLGLKLK